MKHKRILPALLLSGSALAAGTGELNVTTGLDYSTGDYGTSTTSETWYVPIAVKYETGRMTYKATIPYLRVSNAVVSPDGDPIQGTDCSGTETGLGDITASAGYNLLDGSANGLLLDAVAKLKMPTAESKCLGNNKTDYALQFDAAKAFGPVTAFGTVGWKDMGNSELRNPFYASLGIGTKLGPTTTVGAAYDWRARLRSSGDPIREASLFLSQKLSTQWKLQVYGVKGFSDNSPDWGGGVMVGYTY
ncbi:hypothetical protein AzCIB_1321 [Azoarcus sp. CIB]|uniref:hypothetical protein n=1 Tax=Aromatoleum sp. (strain CIB) TaxID=198107 RepID=UPI00067E5F0D|nr:hypothetical protein [Azoarcus sp. CIB]AKU11226.1 hypothetical protein AzCIB_1321 [Azoarcus sp. CIB]